MDYKGKQISGRDIATVELLEEIKAYFSEDGAALNALALGGVTATNYALKSDVAQSIADLVGTAPDTLDTIQELAEALKNNKDIVDTLDEAITAKAEQTDLDEAVGRITTLENSATKVSFAQTLTTGTKIGSITIDGTETNIYAPSLTGYATQSWVNQQGFITGITSNMITHALGYQPISQTWINNQGFAKSADIEAFLRGNYVSSEQLVLQLANYATHDYINDKLANNYYDKEDIDSRYSTTEAIEAFLKSNYISAEKLGLTLLNYVPSAGGKFDALTINYSFADKGNYVLYVNGRTGINGTLNALQGVVIPTGKTLKIGDATISWDSTNKALKVDKPMYSTGTIASGGVLAAASQLKTLEARVKALEDRIGLTN